MERKILIYINNISRFNYGNLKSNLELMRGFSERGFNVKFVVNKTTESDVKVPVEVIPLNAKGDFDRPFKLKKVIEKEKPVAIIANMYTQIVTTSLAKMLMKDKRTKYIGIARDVRYWHRKFWKIPFRLFVKRIYENMDKIIAISEAVEDDVKKTFFVSSEKVCVIYNPIDVREINEKAKEPLTEQEVKFFKHNNVITFVGRLDKQKAPILALDVFREVYKQIKSVKLCFIGDGELREELENKVKSYGLSERVLILGYRENPYKYIARSKVIIHTAIWEGLGRVIIESMALGVPTFALYNEFSGYKTLLKRCKCGILVPFDRPEELSYNLISVFNEPKKLEILSEKSKKFALQFDRENIISEYIKILGF